MIVNAWESGEYDCRRKPHFEGCPIGQTRKRSFGIVSLMWIFNIRKSRQCVRRGVETIRDPTWRKVIDNQKAVVIIAERVQCWLSDILPAIILYHKLTSICVSITHGISNGKISGRHRNWHVAGVGTFNNRSNPHNAMCCVDIARSDLHLAGWRFDTIWLGEGIINASRKDDSH